MTYPIKSPRKLIEVALPLDAINEASAREKSIRHGHPSSLHLWWARRPLAAARAVIFAQLVNDPGYQQGGGFKYGMNKKDAAVERRRLFKIIEELVQWENTNNEDVLERARAEIRRSWREVCELNKNHPQAAKLFNSNKMPALHDPFAGGGSIPLEAQRLGLEAYASDLNPIAVLINKATIEIPPEFAGKAPVNPEARKPQNLLGKTWKGAAGLAEDVHYYGTWMREQAQKRIGHFYPSVEISAEMARERPDLKPLVGRKLTVITWLWARTVKSPNPAFSHIDVPLVGSFSLCAKKGSEAWIDPVLRPDHSGYDFVVRVHGSLRMQGTVDRNGGTCLMSGTPMPFEYIRAEAQVGRMSQRLLAIVAETNRRKIYLSPSSNHEELFESIDREEGPSGAIPDQALGIRVQLYGINEYSALFNRRQLLMLRTLAQLVRELASIVASQPGSSEAYSRAVQTYLALAMGRYADYGSTMTYWDDRGPSIQKTFGLPTLQMRWSYPETNPFADFSGSFSGMVEGARTVLVNLPDGIAGRCWQADATAPSTLPQVVVSTDPPYYDNIGYAALSDYFYIWLKLALRSVYPDLFATILTPKEAELIAEPGRHGSKAAAAVFFEERFAGFARELLGHSHHAFPTTIYYAFKQAELEREGGLVASTGWEVFLGGLVNEGWQVLGTWPMRTEQSGGLRLVGRNSLASSIVLVCRKRSADAPTISRREFVRELNTVLPEALDEMTKGAGDDRSPVAPVDLSQAIIGPGMASFSKYTAVLEADGTPMSVRMALRLINHFLAEDDFDADTQFCLHWFDQYGWNAGPFGEADVLARAKGTSVGGVKDAGVVEAGGGNVRLRRWTEYPANWDPKADIRNPVWETLHHLIRALRQEGETSAGYLLAGVLGKGEAARQLAYRLYTLCERQGWAEDARAYNELITSWGGIETAANAAPVAPTQPRLFE